MFKKINGSELNLMMNFDVCPKCKGKHVEVKIGENGDILNCCAYCGRIRSKAWA
jgi:Zn finger protein HypA/HybF involved in hydrogenase expression